MMRHQSKDSVPRLIADDFKSLPRVLICFERLTDLLSTSAHLRNAITDRRIGNQRSSAEIVHPAKVDVERPQIIFLVLFLSLN
jgi:hypothetical protein